MSWKLLWRWQPMYRHPSLSAVNWFQKNRLLSETALTRVTQKGKHSETKVSNIILHYHGFRQEHSSETAHCICIVDRITIIWPPANDNFFTESLHSNQAEHWSTNLLIQLPSRHSWPNIQVETPMSSYSH
jgi:hypothetical protein